MFGLTIGKLIVLVVVILAVWRGLKMLQRMQEPQRVRRQPGAKPTQPQAGAMDLVACPHCGLYIPKSRPCPGPQHCVHRAAG